MHGTTARKSATGLAAGLALALGAGVAQAACDVEQAGADLSFEDAGVIYDCLKDAMYAGYSTGEKQWIPQEFVDDYRNWGAASTLPGNPGFHAERFLMTYVNDVGFDEYVKFAEEGVKMPAGTVIAKESFSVDDDGKVTTGPLFFMQKVEDGVSPETGDWYYMAVAASGAPMAAPVMTACNECHTQFEAQDRLGYPIEEVRVGR